MDEAETPDLHDDDPDWRIMFAVPRAYGVVAELLNACRIKMEEGFPVQNRKQLWDKVYRHWGFFKIMTDWERTHFVDEVIRILNRDPDLRDVAVVLDPNTGV